MQRSTRQILDRSFSGLGLVSLLLLAASLVVVLLPILWRGAGAFIYRGTVEDRRLMLDLFGRGDPAGIAEDYARAMEVRQPLYDRMAAFEAYVDTLGFAERRALRSSFSAFEEAVRHLLGPEPGLPRAALIRDQYGQTRWERARLALQEVLYREEWDYSDPTQMGIRVEVPRVEEFRGTPLEPAFAYLESNLEGMLRPRLKFYWRFLTDTSTDAHFFGGIWAELLGTLYLTIGALLFAIPMGTVSAIYLTEYARQGRLITMIRTSINTLAGVPSIVFGLFGLAFFINGIGVSNSKSVLAGSLTLGLLVLPVIIRASEEAILAVPVTYKEAALSLGAGKWWTVLTVVLPAALPGILTGIVISMGRAAGETAPIIFTAAVSVGQPLRLFEVFSQPTPALPWNIYNLATEHEAVDQIRHVQYGMVATLVLLVLLLNLTAIIMRARIARKLKG